MSDIGHNRVAEISEKQVNATTARLRSFVERIERLNEELEATKADQREVYSELKSDGFCPKTIRKVVAERKKESDKKAEEDALFDTYWSAL